MRLKKSTYATKVDFRCDWRSWLLPPGRTLDAVKEIDFFPQNDFRCDRRNWLLPPKRTLDVIKEVNFCCRSGLYMRLKKLTFAVEAYFRCDWRSRLFSPERTLDATRVEMSSAQGHVWNSKIQRWKAKKWIVVLENKNEWKAIKNQ
jgi:hypothetical protein